MENVNDMVEPFVLNPFWSSPPSPDFSGSELSPNDVEAPLAPLVEFGGLSPTTLANVGDSSITMTSLKFQFDSFTHIHKLTFDSSLRICLSCTHFLLVKFGKMLSLILQLQLNFSHLLCQCIVSMLAKHLMRITLWPFLVVVTKSAAVIGSANSDLVVSNFDGSVNTLFLARSFVTC